MWNQLKTIILLGVLSAALVGFGRLVAPGWGWAFVALALAVNVGAYWFSDRLVLRMHGARELSPAEAPRLHGMVAELAQRAELPRPRVYLIEDPHANAFATGRNPRHGVVAVTTGLLELLSPRELRGVLAHELAHIKNRDILVSSVAAVLATALTSLANLVQFSALFGGSQSEEEEGGSPLGALYERLLA